MKKEKIMRVREMRVKFDKNEGKVKEVRGINIEVKEGEKIDIVGE